MNIGKSKIQQEFFFRIYSQYHYIPVQTKKKYLIVNKYSIVYSKVNVALDTSDT